MAVQNGNSQFLSLPTPPTPSLARTESEWPGFSEFLPAKQAVLEVFLALMRLK